MNKSETKEVAKLDAISRVTQDIGMLARAYSTMVRATRTTKSRNEIICHAAAIPAVVQHPEFIV